MTYAQLVTAFKVGMNKSDTQYSKSYEPEEIDLFLNQAQERIIKNRFESENFYRPKAFEGSQKRIDDLRVLVKRDFTLTPAQVSGVTNEYSVTLPADYMFFISGNCKIECGTTFVSGGTGLPTVATNIAEVYNVTHADLNYMIDDPFNKPDWKRVLIDFETTKIYIHAETGFFPIKFYLTYLRYPVAINTTGSVTSELPDHVHNEIVATAVSIAIENALDPRVQTIQNELNKIE